MYIQTWVFCISPFWKKFLFPLYMAWPIWIYSCHLVIDEPFCLQGNWFQVFAPPQKKGFLWQRLTLRFFLLETSFISLFLSFSFNENWLSQSETPFALNIYLHWNQEILTWFVMQIMIKIETHKGNSDFLYWDEGSQVARSQYRAFPENWRNLWGSFWGLTAEHNLMYRHYCMAWGIWEHHYIFAILVVYSFVDSK